LKRRMAGAGFYERAGYGQSENPGLKHLPLREWPGPQCGPLHDRDLNAANNLLKPVLSLGDLSRSVRPFEPGGTCSVRDIDQEAPTATGGGGLRRRRITMRQCLILSRPGAQPVLDLLEKP
jgi:hypothetical protein